MNQAIENKKLEFTQKELAERFGISTSTVFNALKIPRESGAIDVTGKNFSVRDTEKFLYSAVVSWQSTSDPGWGAVRLCCTQTLCKY